MAEEAQGRNRAFLARSGLIGGQQEMKTSLDLDKYEQQQMQELQNKQQQKIQGIQAEARKLAEANISENKNLALKAAGMKFDQANTQRLTDLQEASVKSSIKVAEQEAQRAAESFKLAQRDKAVDLLKELGTSNAA